MLCAYIFAYRIVQKSVFGHFHPKNKQIDLQLEDNSNINLTIAHLLVAWNSLYDPSGPIYYILLLIFGVVVKICPKPILCILEIFFTVSKKFPWIILYQNQLLFPVKTAETWLHKIQKKPMLQFDMRWFRNFLGLLLKRIGKNRIISYQRIDMAIILDTHPISIPKHVTKNELNAPKIEKIRFLRLEPYKNM